MKAKNWPVLGVGLLAGGLVYIIGAPIDNGVDSWLQSDRAPSRASAESRRLIAEYWQWPMRYEANTGQASPEVSFLSRGQGYSLWLTSSGVILHLQSHRKADSRDCPLSARRHPSTCELQPATQVRLRFIGANPSPQAVGLRELPGKTSYFLGDDPRQWRPNAPAYAAVRYQDVYPGVDVVYYGGVQRRLEYDFVLTPGADPHHIVLAFEGAEKIEMDVRGDLLLHTANGPLRQLKPIAYQMVNGQRRNVEAGYRLVAEGENSILAGAPPVMITASSTSSQNSGQIKNQNSKIKNEAALDSRSATCNLVKLRVATCDPTLPLIIDPELAFSTLWGGSGDDQAYGVAVDKAGDVYVVGQTTSPDFPSAMPSRAMPGGNYDVFVAKFNPRQSALVYFALLGGSANDRAFQVAVDAAGQAVLVGATHSTNFPARQAIQPHYGGGDSDGFVAKLNPTGSALVFASCLGGSGADHMTCVAVDAANDIYIGGATTSTNLPTREPFQGTNRGGCNAMVAKLTPEGAVQYCTYLGGSGAYDPAIDLAVDRAGNVYLTGYTASPDFPIEQGIQSKLGGGFDAFLAKLNPTGSALVYSTYLGGGANDMGRSLAVDSHGNAYVSGDTFSTNFPIHSAFQIASAGGRDVFVTKFNAAGSALVYSTYLGGSGEELAGIAVDSNGCAYLAGMTSSTNFPATNALQATFGGGAWDAFVAKLNPAGANLFYATYLGGNGNDEARSIAVDAAGNACIAGVTASTNFISVKPLQASYWGGGYDAFVATIFEVKPEAEPVETKVVPQPVAALEVTTVPPEHAPVVPEKAEPPAEKTPTPAPEKPVSLPVTNVVAQPQIVVTTAVAVATLPAPPPITTNQSLPSPTTVVGDTNLLQQRLFGTNLIANAGAEAGDAAISSYGTAPVPGWAVSNSFTVLRYGIPGGFPAANDPGPAERGLNLFVGGADNASSSATQTIDVTAASAAIDKGLVTCLLAGYFGGLGGQNDYAVLEATFKDSNDVGLGKASTSPVTLADRDYHTALLRREALGLVPPGTRKIAVHLQMNRVNGTYNDATADELSLVLSLIPAK